VRTSFRDLDKRLSRLERLLDPPSPCNCRCETRFHNSHCLLTVLWKADRDCPVHGFREMGFFFWTPTGFPIVDEDNQFCPCAPDPWRSFLLGPRPLTWEGHYAARKAAAEMPEEPCFIEDEKVLIEAIIDAYVLEKEEWMNRTHHRLPSKKQIIKQTWKRYEKKPPR
jgi:hypothetical protein